MAIYCIKRQNHTNISGPPGLYPGLYSVDHPVGQKDTASPSFN